uniref:WAP domain-containing protein n=1 Tax=Phasianus colchicus TaxID=9054 RepID=A0A669PFG9_PHACC
SPGCGRCEGSAMEPGLLLLLLLLTAPWAKEDFRPWIDTDPTTNCMNKCTVESNCRGSGKCCRIGCLQQQPWLLGRCACGCHVGTGSVLAR